MRILPKAEHKMKLISHPKANQTTLNHLWFLPKFYCLGSCHFLFLPFTSLSSIQINSLNSSNALPWSSPVLPFGHKFFLFWACFFPLLWYLIKCMSCLSCMHLKDKKYLLYLNSSYYLSYGFVHVHTHNTHTHEITCLLSSGSINY